MTPERADGGDLTADNATPWIRGTGGSHRCAAQNRDDRRVSAYSHGVSAPPTSPVRYRRVRRWAVGLVAAAGLGLAPVSISVASSTSTTSSDPTSSTSVGGESDTTAPSTTEASASSTTSSDVSAPSEPAPSSTSVPAPDPATTAATITPTTDTTAAGADDVTARPAGDVAIAAIGDPNTVGVAVSTSGGDGTFSFVVTGDDGSSAPLSVTTVGGYGQSDSIPTFAGVTYTVAATSTDGWIVRQPLACSDPATGETDLQFTAVEGAAYRCSMDLARSGTATLSVTKFASAPGTSFDFALTGPSTESFSLQAGQVANLTVAPGAYSLTEIATPGWTYEGTVCIDELTFEQLPVTQLDDGAAFDLADGAQVSCQVRNSERNPEPNPIQLMKSASAPVLLDESIGLYEITYDLQIYNWGNPPATIDLDDTLAFGAGVTLQSASATGFGIDTEPGWDGTGALVTGAVVNDFTSIRVTATFIVDPDIAAAAADCTLAAGESGTGLRNEATLSAGDTTAWASACRQVPSFTGLVIEKYSSGGDGTFSFQVTDEAGVSQTVDVTTQAGQGDAVIALPPGTYTVTELDNPAFFPSWRTCVDFDPETQEPQPAPFTVTQGVLQTCTFYNEAAGTIEVNKVAVPADGTTFPVEIVSADAGEVVASLGVESGQTVVSPPLPRGQYVVRELTPTGWVNTSVVCVGDRAVSPSAVEGIVNSAILWVGSGSTTRCTLRNARLGPVEVDKQVVSGPTVHDDGSVDVVYGITVTNTAGVPHRYQLDDRLEFAAGVAVVSASAVNDVPGTVSVSSTWDGVADTVLVADQPIAPAGVHRFTVTVRVADPSDVAAELRDCDAALTGGLGLTNSASVTMETDEADAARACASLAAIVPPTSTTDPAPTTTTTSTTSTTSTTVPSTTSTTSTTTTSTTSPETTTTVLGLTTTTASGTSVPATGPMATGPLGTLPQTR